MKNIDPKLLRAFLQVAEERSFSAAGRRLGLSANTVSLRVRTLEKRLGTRLFDRRGGGAVLSPSGRDLLPAAREIVEMNDQLLESAASISPRAAAGPGRRSSGAAVSAGPNSPPQGRRCLRTGARS